MHRDLLIQAFEKAGAETGSGNTSRQARHLSDTILEASGEPFGERSLREYYKKAREGEGVELKGYVVSALCQFLGHEDYAAFLRAQGGAPGGRPRPWRKRALQAAGAVAGGALLLLGGIKAVEPDTPRAMVWMEDHFEEVAIDPKQHPYSELEDYDADRIATFRKVVPDCNYAYFDEKGVERLWYGKNRQGELEYFTALGPHPETGKTLKRITPYMIRKYLCPTFAE